jgi:hypothetical protein
MNQLYLECLQEQKCREVSYFCRLNHIANSFNKICTPHSLLPSLCPSIMLARLCHSATIPHGVRDKISGVWFVPSVKKTLLYVTYINFCVLSCDITCMYANTVRVCGEMMCEIIVWICHRCMLCMVNKEKFNANSELMNIKDHILGDENKHTYMYRVSTYACMHPWTCQLTDQPATHILTNHIVVLILSGQGLYTVVSPWVMEAVLLSKHMATWEMEYMCLKACGMYL